MILNNKVVLITGAANGIGKALTQRFLEKGATVYACDIDTAHLDEHFGQSSNCIIQSLDVSNNESWASVFKDLKKIDYLLNVAGVIRPGYITETVVDAIDLQIDVNLKGTIYGTQWAAEKMKGTGGGHIINFASMAGIAPIAGISIYTASKFGVRGFSLAMVQELKAHNIKVSVICPDAVDTHMLDDQMNSQAAAMTFSTNKILTVEEIADAVLKEAIQNEKPEVWIPFQRGVQAYLGATFPKLAGYLTKLLVKQGLKKQEKFRKGRGR
ncbi:MAG: SDR family oxidoreductase [Bacteroidetes bacterium]|nr:SDR family oxidoreductase [Bacteroidota bacterium]